MDVNILSLGLGMIGAAVLIGYVSMLVITLSSLVESIANREVGWFVVALMFSLVFVGLGLFFAGLITQ